MIEFKIHARLGAGDLTFGTERDNVRSMLDSLGFAMTSSSGNMDFYDDNSIQLDFFDDDILHWIGFAYSANSRVSYNTVDPFDQNSSELFDLINSNESPPIPFNDYDPLFPTQIIALWDAQEQYDYNGNHQRRVFATFSIGDQRYLDEMLAITRGG